MRHSVTNNKWKAFWKKVATVWNILKYGWSSYMEEVILATLALTLLICAIVGAYIGFCELAIACASISATLLVGVMLSSHSREKVLAGKGNIHARKLLSSKWSTDLDGIRMGSSDGEIYLVVITHAGYIFRVDVYDTRLRPKAEELGRLLEFFKNYRDTKIHYIKVIDLLRLSLDAEYIGKEF